MRGVARTDRVFAGGARGLLFLAVNAAIYVRHPRRVAVFRRRVGYFPNVARPARHGEKMFWRKVFDHNPTFVTCVDKVASKRWAATISEVVAPPPTLWTGVDPHEIPETLLSEPTVLKATHACNFTMFLAAGADPLEIDADMTGGWLATTYGREHLEWAYQSVRPALVLEVDVARGERARVVDLSVHSVSGSPVIVELIANNKTDDVRKAYFRPTGERWSEIERSGPAAASWPMPPDATLPPCIDVVLSATRQIGSALDYARIDFLVADGEPYLGEITVYPGAGLSAAGPFAAYNEVLEAAWDLRQAFALRRAPGGARGIYHRAVHRWLSTTTTGGDAPPFR